MTSILLEQLKNLQQLKYREREVSMQQLPQLEPQRVNARMAASMNEIIAALMLPDNAAITAATEQVRKEICIK